MKLSSPRSEKHISLFSGPMGKWAAFLLVLAFAIGFFTFAANRPPEGYLQQSHNLREQAKMERLIRESLQDTRYPDTAFTLRFLKKESKFAVYQVTCTFPGQVSPIQAYDTLQHLHNDRNLLQFYSSDILFEYDCRIGEDGSHYVLNSTFDLLEDHNGAVIYHPRAEEAAVLEEMRAFYRDKIPFVGMKEIYLSDTSLGRAYCDLEDIDLLEGIPEEDLPAPSDHFGQFHIPAPLSREEIRFHYFNTDGDLIYTAVCQNGQVKRVYSYRNDPKPSEGVLKISWMKYRYDREFPYYFGRGVCYDAAVVERASRQRSDRARIYAYGDFGIRLDEYEAWEFADPDEFYEEYGSEFGSYEEAEDYWLEYN